MRNPSRVKARRWYRCKNGIWWNAAAPSCAAFLSASLVLLGGAVSRNGGQILVGGLLAAVCLLSLTANLRAGIGITDQGVLVRSALGWTRWASWSEIDHFEIVKQRYQREGGKGVAIAVMLINRRPLVTLGCSYQPWDKWTDSNRKILQDLLNTLEDERAAAQRSLRLSSG